MSFLVAVIYVVSRFLQRTLRDSLMCFSGSRGMPHGILQQVWWDPTLCFLGVSVLRAKYTRGICPKSSILKPLFGCGSSELETILKWVKRALPGHARALKPELLCLKISEIGSKDTGEKQEKRKACAPKHGQQHCAWSVACLELRRLLVIVRFGGMSGIQCGLGSGLLEALSERKPSGWKEATGLR